LKLNLLFGIHCHQPVGNFDKVFLKAYKESYLPFLKTLARFPKVKCNIHISGPLWDWLYETGQSELIEILTRLSQTCQIEFLSGAYYEPILPLIPYSDQINQINRMNSFIREKFGQEPKGLWLAERVWEPSLSKTINKTGLKFALLDDTHFLKAGLSPEEIKGFFTTEESGLPIHLFPINKELRYKIPFSEISETESILKNLKEKFAGHVITIVDDGEKFGAWPGTYDWVYKKGWLEKFFTLLETNSSWINTLTFSQALSSFQPEDIAYIPTSTYEEMAEWVLEPSQYQKLIHLKEKYPDTGFLQGGFFRNFLKKYKDINYMHKRMINLSRQVNQKFTYSENKELFEPLFKAQCNCAYWHGLFGGFYLPHLRNAVYQNLIETEKILDKTKSCQLEIEEEDFDFDSKEEILLKNKDLIVVISPARGGTIEEISSKPFSFNFVNTLTRKEEIYHSKYGKYLEADRDKPKSIHQMPLEHQKELDEHIVYDTYRKTCLIDHWTPKNLSLAETKKNKNLTSLTDRAYISKITQNQNKLDLSLQNKNHSFSINKNLTFSEDKPGFKVSYLIEITEKNILQTRNFAVEFNLSSFGVTSTYFKLDGENIYHIDQALTTGRTNTLEIIDSYTKSKLYFELKDLEVMFFPVYSVSLSEHKTEKIFQYTSFFFIKKINREKEEFSINFRILRASDTEC
jgi:4-alpha-glucanotransferase